MRVLRFKRRTHLLVFQISERKRDVSIRSAVLLAETSNHTLIPALLNLLQRRNSRGPTPPPPGGGPTASYQSVRSASLCEIFTSGQAMPLGYCPWWDVIYTCSVYVTPLPMWPKLTESAKLRSVWAGRPPRKPERSVLSIYTHCHYLTCM